MSGFHIKGADLAPVVYKGNQSLPEFQVNALVDEVSLIGRVVRFMEGDASQQHPAIHVLEGIWPSLLQLLESPVWSASSEVMGAVCEVFKVTIKVAACGYLGWTSYSL